jgi:diguanylate cyclase (GGDEF)-like protein/PAS domain S-box-containing protein
MLRGAEVQSVSESVRDLLGWEPTLCVGRTLSELFGRDTYQLLDDLQTSAERAGGHLATHRGLGIEHDEGHIVWVDVTIADRRDDPEVGGALITMHDVSERVGIEQRIKSTEHHDPLTETANAAMFDVLLDRALAQGCPVGVIIVGTPGLESINHMHGSEVGDAVLIEMSRRLAAVIRTGDYVSRVSNARFGMIVHHLADDAPTEDLAEVAQRINDTLAAPMQHGSVTTHVALTIRSEVSTAGDTSTGLLERALSAPISSIS